MAESFNEEAVPAAPNGPARITLDADDYAQVLGAHLGDAEEAWAAACNDAIDKFVAPFAATFAILKDVDLAELPTEEVLPELSQVDAQVRQAALGAIDVLIAGRGSVQLVLRALQSMPDQKRIPRGLQKRGDSKLGSEARRLLPLVRQSASKNRSTLLIGAGAAISIAMVTWAYRADKADQRAATALELLAAQHPLLSQLEADRKAILATVLTDATTVLQALTEVGIGRLSALTVLVKGNGDYATYTTEEQRLTAEAAALAQAVAAVTSCPTLDLDGESVVRFETTMAVARQIVEGRAPAPGRTRVADAVVADALAHSTRPQREQIAYLLSQPALVQRMQDRFSNKDIPIQHGHYFEWLHELSYNYNAIAQGGSHRLMVTEWLGRPHDPADLEMLDASENVVRMVQAKVIADKSKRLSSQSGLANSKYEAMDLLVPSDHRTETEDFLGRRLAMPRGIHHDRYEDIQERLTDVVTSNGISSDPVTTGRLSEVANDPNGYLARVTRDTQLQHLVTTAVLTGGSQALIGIATESACHRLEAGTFDGFDWTDAAVRAVRTGVATATVAATASGLESAAQKAVAEGAESTFISWVADEQLAAVLVQASVDVAVIVHGFTTGRLTAEKAATATAESLTQTTAVWIGSTIGRKLIPVPVLGAMVGGIAGQFAATVIIQGIRLAVVGRDATADHDADYDNLLAATEELARACDAERSELHRLASEYRVAFTDRVLPALDRLAAGSATEDLDATLADLADLIANYASNPIFATLDEFNAFMADANAALVLDVKPVSRP